MFAMFVFKVAVVSFTSIYNLGSLLGNFPIRITLSLKCMLSGEGVGGATYIVPGSDFITGEFLAYNFQRGGGSFFWMLEGEGCSKHYFDPHLAYIKGPLCEPPPSLYFPQESSVNPGVAGKCQNSSIIPGKWLVSYRITGNAGTPITWMFKTEIISNGWLRYFPHDLHTI